MSPPATIGSQLTAEVAFLEGKPLVVPQADPPLAISKLVGPFELVAPLAAASLAASRLAVLVVVTDKRVEGELLAFLLLTF